MKPYAEPRNIERLEDCLFYHTIELPGIGIINGQWDLRGRENQYLGGFDFRGKRALDVGCANGILSFYMENQGAEVVSYDLDKTEKWDLIPFAKWEQYQQITKVHKGHIDSINNAYWYCHRALQSKAKMAYGSVYAIPSEIGLVDVAVFGSILLHLRDPLGALQSGLRLTKGTAIVTEPLRGETIKPKRSRLFKHLSRVLGKVEPEQNPSPCLILLPDSRTIEPKDTWWDVKPQWTIQALGVLGFEDAKVTYHSQQHGGREERLYTVVAARTHGVASVE